MTFVNFDTFGLCVHFQMHLFDFSEPKEFNDQKHCRISGEHEILLFPADLSVLINNNLNNTDLYYLFFLYPKFKIEIELLNESKYRWLIDIERWNYYFSRNCMAKISSSSYYLHIMTIWVLNICNFFIRIFFRSEIFGFVREIFQLKEIFGYQKGVIFQ